MMLLLEKRRETGILKGMGLNKSDGLKIYLFLGWITGGIGLISGFTLSLVFLLWQQYFPFITLPQDVYFIKYLPVIVNFQDVILTLFALVVIITVSALIPAWRVNQLKPIQSIKIKN